MFKHEMGSTVTNQVSGESGEVVGRAEHAHAESSYRVRFKDAQGHARTEWWEESELA